MRGSRVVLAFERFFCLYYIFKNILPIHIRLITNMSLTQTSKLNLRNKNQVMAEILQDSHHNSLIIRPGVTKWSEYVPQGSAAPLHNDPSGSIIQSQTLDSPSYSA